MKFSSQEIQSLLGFQNTVEQQGDDKESENGVENDILLSRRIARYFSKRFSSWYGRDADIDQSWAYFERIVLPRRMKVEIGDQKENEESGGETGGEHKKKKKKQILKTNFKYVRAPVGTTDRKTTLYPAWTTSGRDLADFGTGIAVYFETMRVLMVILLIAGLLYIPNFEYYKSDNYDPHQESSPSSRLSSVLRGSLICETFTWVPCPNCTLDEWHETPHRIAFLEDGNDADTDPMVFVMKNACEPLRWQQGLNHLVVVAFLVIALIGLSIHQEKQELKYDELVLTASDYSIKVDNPPLDAFDPDEWQRFFNQFGQQQQQVVYVTVALHNEDLINLLVKRRNLLQKLSYKIKGRNDKEPLQLAPQELQDEEPKLYSKLKTLEDKCQALLKKKYDVSAVFITFDTEYAQRQALEKLTVGSVHVAANNKKALSNPQHAFRGELVLDVYESVEPSSIRWQDLDETMFIRLCQRLVSYSITFAIVYAGFITVKNGFERGSSFAAFEIVILNIIVPILFRFVNLLESHPNESSYQASLYTKVCIFRWINTAVITTVVKPLLLTLEDSKSALIPSVYKILKAEIITVPLVHMLDIMGNIKRHVLAPRAANQAAMNSFFTGAPGFLGEKYTGVTKIVFLCFFYAVIFPSSFFFGAAALGVTYMTEKFNLLRSWAPMPELGNDVAKLSRQVFFPLALLALAVMSEFYWSAYPFDNVCESDLLVGDDYKAFERYIGNHTLQTAEMIIASTSAKNLTKNKSPPTFDVNVDEQSMIYRFCDQDFLERLSALFAFFYEEKNDWMSEDQIALTFIFGLVCFVVITVFSLHILWTTVLPSIRKGIGTEKYTTEEIDSKQKYSDQSPICAYIPQVKSRAFPHPLLACDIGQIDHRHIGWTDPIRGHAYYDMSEDVRFLTQNHEENDNKSGNPVLSVARHYKPLLATANTTKYGSMETRATGKRRTFRI